MDEKSSGLEALRALAGFLPVMEAPDFSAGSWVRPPRNEDGSQTFPYTTLSEAGGAFYDAVYEHGWVMMDFDWPEWMRTEEAIWLRDNPDALQRASAEQLAMLLTTYIRQDRYVEGALLEAFESGLILPIARRAKALLDEAEAAAS